MSDSNYQNIYPALNSSGQSIKTTNDNDNNGVNNQSHEGWLHKKGEKGLIQTWKRRYFVANIDAVNYYTDSQKRDYRGTIIWDHIINVIPTQSAVWSDNRYFQLGTNRGRVYYLFADDSETAESWIENLKILKDSNQIKRQLQLQQQQQQQQQSPKTSSSQQQYGEEELYDENGNAIQQQQKDRYGNYLDVNGVDRSPSLQGNGGGVSSPYRDFLNYAPSFNHFDSIGSPIQEQTSMDSSLHVPPRPPGQMRAIDPVMANTIIPSEGRDLEIYYTSTTHFADLLVQRNNDYNILSLYLVLSTLDWDNKKTQPLPYPCTPPYESDIVFPYFIYTLHLTRSEIINRWKEGAAMATQIDNFTKKKRKNYLMILENEDRETFLNRNILLLNYAMQQLVANRKMPTIEDAMVVLIDRFLENYESLPSFKYGSFLWREIENADKNQALIPNEKPTLKSFTHSYLLYQKLHLENKNNTKFKLDPIISQKYENASHYFSVMLHQLPLLSTFSGHIQRTIVKIFYLWHKDLPLCENQSTSDVCYYRNYKVFSRILSKLDPTIFPQLFTSIKDTRDTLYQVIDQYIGTFDINNVDTTPLESIINHK